jgi:hypothetical protein
MMDKKIKQALIGEFLASIKPEFREELKDMMEQIVDQMEEWGIDDPRSEEGRKILAAKLKEKDEESPYADESPEEQIARIEVGQRIADYLQFNGFKNLEEAQERGWGELSPLRARSDHRSEEKH